MKILEVMPALPPATGTTEFFVESIRAMMRQGVQVDVLCGDTCGNELGEAHVFSNLKDYTSTLQPDIVHIHALWLPFNHQAHVWAHRCGIPVVVSTHGSLSPWAMASKRWKKIPYWYLIERWDLKNVAALHVTAPAEGEWDRKWCPDIPQIEAPLGVDVPSVSNVDKVVDGCRIIQYVGRIYSVKGLDRVVRAVKILKDTGKWHGWRLVMSGPNWMNYQPELERLIADLDLQNDAFITGAIYGAEKERRFREASIYIQASHTENFAQPIAEALSYGVPAVASRGCPWQGLETHDCGMWVDNDPESLARALERLMSLSDEERQKMGARGRAWVERDFSWSAVGRKLLDAYDDLKLRGATVR